MRPNPQETGDLVTFTEEILDGKLHFLCSVSWDFFLQDFMQLLLQIFLERESFQELQEITQNFERNKLSSFLDFLGL